MSVDFDHSTDDLQEFKKNKICFHYLHNHSVFSRLTDAQLQYLSLKAKVSKYLKDKNVESGHFPAIHVIVNGKFKLMGVMNGRKQLKCFLDEGDMFGHLDPNELSLVELAKSASNFGITLKIDTTVLQKLLSANLNFMEAFLRYSWNRHKKWKIAYVFRMHPITFHQDS